MVTLEMWRERSPKAGILGKYFMLEKNRKQVSKAAVDFEKMRRGHCRKVWENDTKHRENHTRNVY
jgi:hypothetical protein